MFEGLDEVPWKKRSHVYGKATDVPGWIRDLRSPDAAARKKAVFWLEAALNHQGKVCAATVDAVPFVVEAFAATDTPDRPEIAALLAGFATGDPDDHLAKGFKGPKGAVPTLVFQAFRDGAPAFLAALRDADPTVRAAAAYLLAWSPEDAGAWLPAIQAAYDAETDPWARASQTLAIAFLDGYLGLEADPRLRSGTDAATIGLAHLGAVEVDAWSALVLRAPRPQGAWPSFMRFGAVDAWALGQAPEARLWPIPWAGGRWWELAFAQVGHLPKKARATVIEACIRLREGHSELAIPAGEHAWKLVSKESGLRDRLLRAWIDGGEARYGAIREQVAAQGLPSAFAELAAHLGLPVPAHYTVGAPAEELARIADLPVPEAVDRLFAVERAHYRAGNIDLGPLIARDPAAVEAAVARQVLAWADRGIMPMHWGKNLSVNTGVVELAARFGEALRAAGHEVGRWYEAALGRCAAYQHDVAALKPLAKRLAGLPEERRAPVLATVDELLRDAAESKQFRTFMGA